MKQIMMKGKQRVKGTVLFTVVTVMMVMVVFLMSTLILTTSANRRSYYTYYQTQAQYAAQSALDCITNFAYSDSEFSEWVFGIADDNPHEIFINYDGSKMPLSDVNAPNKSIRCTIQREKPNHIYDTVTQKIHERDQWKITATAVIGTGRNQTTASKASYLYSNVKAPKLTDVKNDITYTKYNYDEETTEEETDEWIDDPDTAFTPMANAVYQLSPTGTDDNVSVLGPQYSGMTRIPKGRTKYGDQNGSFQAIKNDLGGVTDMIFNGNCKITVKTGYVFQNPGEGIQYYGNLLFNNAGDFYSTRTTSTTKWAYNAQNYVYVDGMVYTSGGKVSIGFDKAAASDTGNTASEKSSRPVNLFAGGVSFPAANSGANVCGDVYLYDPALDSTWVAFKQSSILATFVEKNVSSLAEVPKYSGTHGNLVCNNNKLTLGNGDSGTLTIEGDLLFTNPNGSVTFGSAVHVKGKAMFACGSGKVSGAANLTADGGITYNAQITGNYGKDATTKADITVAAYRTAAGSNDFSLLPFNYRLDEICSKYYRWDLAGVSGWRTDALVKESEACGHKWQTTDFTATVFDHSENVTEHGLTLTELSEYGVTDAYNDPRVTQEGYSDGANRFGFSGSKDVYKTSTVTVPYTTPVDSANIIIKKVFEPVSYTNAAVEVSQRSNLSYKDIASFKSDMSSGAPSISAGDMKGYGYKGSLSWKYPNASGGMSTQSGNVCYVNFDCEFDISDLGSNILFIDPSQAANKPLRIALKGGSDGETVIMINNTAKYTGGGAAPAVGTDYITATDGKYECFGREDVFIFLENGAKLNKTLFVTTGIAGGFPGGTPALGQKLTLDVVSNPRYPGKDGWSSLTGAEKTKFMYVPNDIIFGQENAKYEFANGGLFTGVVMMPYSTLVHKTQAPEIGISYRWNHDSVAVTPNGLSQSGNKPALVSIGSQVVGKFIGENVATVCYIGDGNRSGGRTKKTVTKTEVTPGFSESNNFKDDPAFNDGHDNFNNDHIGLN